MERKSKRPGAGARPAAGPSQRDRSDFVAAPRRAGPAPAPGVAAPEVSQGPWRERAYQPRAVVPLANLTIALEAVIDDVMSTPASLWERVKAIRSGMLPFLRQAVEQAGGDGIDAWLSTLFSPPGVPGKDVLVIELFVAFEKMRQATTAEALEGAAKDCVTAVQRAFISKRAFSFQAMEQRLEGKVELDVLLGLLLSDEAELRARAAEVVRALESLRAEVKALNTGQPSGAYFNYVRLKAEKSVIDAEISRRSAISRRK